MEILLETIEDTILILPLLFIMYLILEYIEHHQNIQLESKLKKYGPILGAFLGVIPQCGLSIMASMLFIENKITLGTLISIFIATSDEAIPLLLTEPQMFSSLIMMVILKVIIAIISGFIIDHFYHRKHINASSSNYHEHHHSTVIEALLRSLKIYAFIFIVQISLSLFIEFIGEEQLSLILMTHSLLQPIAGAIFGFIPNCAASVILTQLYINQVVSFATLLSGLITNAGLGIIVLIQNKIDKTTILHICLILLIISLMVSLPIQWLHLY
jgi:hypothetical protein